MFVEGPRPFELVECNGLRIAMMICYDVEFPETVRAAALAGAQLVVVPTAQMEPFSFVADHLVRVRAWENQVYVAYVNFIGSEGELTYVGRSSVVGPDAIVRDARAHQEGLVVAEIDPDAVALAQTRNPYSVDRRAALYPH